MNKRLLYFEKYLNSVRRNRLHFLFLLFVFLLVALSAGYALWGKRYFVSLPVFLIGNVLNLAIFILAFIIHRAGAKLVLNIYQDPHQSIYRVALWFLVYATTNIAMLYCTLRLYDHFTLFGFVLKLPPALWLATILSAASLIGAGLTELSYTFMQWRTNQDELQQMEHKQLLNELELVKQQVNPHFLFNCLNSLSVLISEAPPTAEKFVDEMSKVYRYLLSVSGFERENNLVTLEAEIRFIRSYVYLLETRFEGGIRIEIQIADLYLNGQIAPLTLQTLIDNAIRHNILSIDKPLRVTVQTTATGQLAVTNNLQKRMVRMPFNSAGLATLISRYKLLFNQAGTIQVSQSESAFTVILPLIYT